MFATIATGKMSETPVAEISTGKYLAIGLETPYQKSNFYVVDEQNGVPVINKSKLQI